MSPSSRLLNTTCPCHSPKSLCYLPPRQKTLADLAAKNSGFQGGCGTALAAEAKDAPGFFGWLDRALDKMG